MEKQADAYIDYLECLDPEDPLYIKGLQRLSDFLHIIALLKKSKALKEEVAKVKAEVLSVQKEMELLYNKMNNYY